MDQQIKRDWVETLRSDRFTQARQQFTEVVIQPQGTVVKHCCLAVLTELACDANVPHIRRKPQDEDGEHPGMFQYESYNLDDKGNEVWTGEWEDFEQGDLPTMVRDWAGLDSTNPELDGIHAIDRNDGRSIPDADESDIQPESYEEIADAIERDPSL